MFRQGGSPYPPLMATVVLYGQSLALSSIGASLRRQKWLELVSLDAAVPGLANVLAAMEADVVIFDLVAEHPDALTLWKTRPGLLLIGIDMASGTATVLSRTSTHVATTDELLHVIRGESPVESTT